MNYIITIGRQFATGGREFGRHLAEELGLAYYDKEILSEVAKRTNFALDYVKKTTEEGPSIIPSFGYENSFMLYSSIDMSQSSQIHSEQSKLINELAEKGGSLFMGRGADYILREKHPFRIFCYADMESRLKRCRERQNEKEAKYTDKKMISHIKSVDKKRKEYYDFYTGIEWGEKENYDLMINLSGRDLKKLAHEVAILIKAIYPKEK